MAFPEIQLFHIELSNACNFKCEFCPITVTRRHPQSMPLPVFRKIIDQLAGNRLASQVLLHVLGEPLLYADILDAVRYANNHGLKVTITTNGSLLNADMIKGLSDCGLYSMDISLQLLGNDHHALRHTGVGFDEYFRNIVNSVRLIQETTNIRLIVKVMNTTYKRLFSFDKPPRFEQQGQEFRRLLLQLIMDLYGATGTVIAMEEVEARLKKTNLDSAIRIRLAERLFVFVQLFMDWGNAFCGTKVYPARIGSCSFAFKEPSVLSDGSVVMCCADYDGETKLGHINDGPLLSILTSEKAQYFRDGFEKYSLRHPRCQRCLGSTSRLMAIGKGLGSIFVSRFMKLQGENVMVLR
ncbi:MAG: radical SAM protein [Kiritimatiellae bacterium]|nr:radical SAM protein [Kiritimatiellia bacterium]MDD5523214.1 radical SAM protein [Kiritimatiellia bacterium]